MPVERTKAAIGHLVIPAQPEHLSAEQLRQLVRGLAAKVSQQAEVIGQKERELNWRQAKIDKLTHELAMHKRRRFAVADGLNEQVAQLHDAGSRLKSEFAEHVEDLTTERLTPLLKLLKQLPINFVTPLLMGSSRPRRDRTRLLGPSFSPLRQRVPS